MTRRWHPIPPRVGLPQTTPPQTGRRTEPRPPAASVVLQASREQHGHAGTIRGVVRTVTLHEIVLLQQDAHCNISAGADRKHEMPDGHGWRRPERDDKTQ